MTTKNFIIYIVFALSYGILIGVIIVEIIVTSKAGIFSIVSLIVLTALIVVRTVIIITNLNSNKKIQESNKLEENH